MIYLDTGVFIAFFVENDLNHSFVKESFSKYYNQGFITSYEVFVETLNWFTHKTNPQVVLKIYNFFAKSEFVKILDSNLSDRDSAIAVIKRYDSSRLTYTDALSFVLINRLKLKYYFSFDSDFDLIKGAQNIRWCK